jgi:hypothetical protein
MGLFKKKTDPISDRAQELTGQIQALEAQIRQLNEQAAQPQPRLRSTARPGGPAPAPAVSAREPIFENVNQSHLKAPPESAGPQHFNELGIRKYDLAAAWERLKNNFRGPSASNPKLVNYLAAGSIQGLRPLRYEKRVARNRFLVFVVVLFLLLWGLIYYFFRR